VPDLSRGCAHRTLSAHPTPRRMSADQLPQRSSEQGRRKLLKTAQPTPASSATPTLSRRSIAVPPQGERRLDHVQRLPRRARHLPSQQREVHGRPERDLHQVATTETRGPFVFEHVAVKAEGCLGCQPPHGSQKPRLLNMPAIAPLCNQCHSGVAKNNTVHRNGAGRPET